MDKMLSPKMRKATTCMFIVIIASTLSFPPLALALDSGTIDDTEIANGTAANGNGSSGGTWAYDGADTITLDNFAGNGIRAFGNTIIDLVGDNAVAGYVSVDGDLTVIGDETLGGTDKPSITLEDDAMLGGSGIETIGEGGLTLKDVNVYANAQFAGIQSVRDLTIEDSAVYRGAGNRTLLIDAPDDRHSSDLLIKGSEIEATTVFAAGVLTLDNTNLAVTPSENAKEQMAQDPDYNWIANFAVFGAKGVELIGEAQPYEVREWESGEGVKYYVYTGSEDEVVLKASAVPAYYAPITSTTAVSDKALPATGDNMTAFTLGMGSALVLSAAVAVFALRRYLFQRG